MSDTHRGLSHDLPEYTPNWPLRARVRVFKAINNRWYWGHACRENCWVSGPTIAVDEVSPPLMGCVTWVEAYYLGDKHARSCP